MTDIHYILQQGISQRTAHQRAPSPNRVRRPHGIEAGVDLDQIHGDEVTCLVHTLADEVSLAKSQSPTHGGSSARCPLRIERIDVKRQMDGCVVSNVSERHLDDTADSVSNPLAIAVLQARGMPVQEREGGFVGGWGRVRRGAYRSTSCMLKALMPFSRRIFFSPRSTSRSPI